MSEPRSPASIVVAVCLALFVVGLISTVAVVHYPDRLRSHNFGGDAVAFGIAIERYAENGSLYFISDPPEGTTSLQPYLTRFLYPPVAVWLLYPVFVWDRVVAAPVWLAITIVVFLATAFHMLSRQTATLDLSADARVLLAWVMTLTLGFWYPFLHHLGVGQVDVLLLALAWIAVDWRRRQPITAAIALALATALKVYPVVLAGFIAVAEQGNTRRFLGAYLTALGALLAAAFVGFGWLAWEQWARVAAFKAAEASPYIVNQSVIGTANRLIGATGPWPHPEAFFLFRTGFQVLVTFCGAAVVWIASRRPPVSAEVLLSVFAVTYALASPLFWVQSYVWLLPAVVLLTGTVLRAPSDRANRRVVTPVLLMALVTQFVVWFDPRPSALRDPLMAVFFHRYLVSQLLLIGILALVFVRWMARPTPP